jgi:hypothetical protein
VDIGLRAGALHQLCKQYFMLSSRRVEFRMESFITNGYIEIEVIFFVIEKFGCACYMVPYVTKAFVQVYIARFQLLASRFFSEEGVMRGKLSMARVNHNRQV